VSIGVHSWFFRLFHSLYASVVSIAGIGLKERRRSLAPKAKHVTLAGQMSFDEFLQSIVASPAGAVPPATLSAPLRALWLDARGDWEAAHEVTQESGDRAGDWVHAYLHRKEGDESNAGYWYSRAGRPMASGSLETEWREIATELLKS
jgi:hypothetical protein